MGEWWTNHENLAALWRWLEERGETPGDGPAYYMSKPWKWAPEWNAYVAERDAKVTLTPEQRDFLAYMARTPYREWFHTRQNRGPIIAVVESMPKGLLSTHLSSIGEDDEKIHVTLTEAGRAAIQDGAS